MRGVRVAAAATTAAAAGHTHTRIETTYGTLDPSQLSFPLKFNMVLVPIPSEARHFVKIFTSFQSSPLKNT